MKLDKSAEVFFIGPTGNYSNMVQYSTIEECYEYCKDKMIIAEDIETTYKFPKGTYKNEDIYKPGIDPYLSKIVMLQIGDKDKIFVIDIRSVDISMLLPLWENKERLWLGHNLKFESKHLLHNYSIIHYQIWDTMLVEQNLTNGLDLGYSLEKLADRYLNVKPVIQKDLFTSDEENEEDIVRIDKSTRMGFLTIGDKPFTQTQILYGADDILYPFLFREKQLQGFRGYAPTVVHQLENEFCLLLSDIELKGKTFNKEQWLRNYEKNKIILHKREQKLNDWVVNKFKNNKKFCKGADLFDPNSYCTIGWGSSKQVIELFKHLGFCPKEKSKSTGFVEYTVGAKALLKLLPTKYKELYAKDKETDIELQEDLILNYLLYKTSEQSCTTFGDEFLKYVHPITGRLHSSYRQILHTGRVSSRAPNLQNIPADDGYRSAFIAPVGHDLINADYSSQESRVLAELSGDKAMISFFNDGHAIHGNDYHSFTGTKMFSLMRNDPNLIITKEKYPEERNAAKSISFKIAYGGSAHTLKDDFGVTEEVAQEFIDSYLKAFPALDNYFKEGKKKAVKNGYIDIDTVTGRRYWDPKWNRMNDLNTEIWKLFPENYKKMSATSKKEVKDQLNKAHPELKGMWSEFFTIQGSLQRCSQNYPIQGLSGSQIKMFAILFRRYQLENNLRDTIYLTSLIHDEALAEVKKEYAEQGLKLVIDKMIEGANMFCSKVKMGAAGGLCQYWKH